MKIHYVRDCAYVSYWLRWSERSAAKRGTLAVMQRIIVIGPGGAGKSTLSRRLGEILNIDVVHLDALFWRPGWIQADKTTWANQIREVVGRESWILDGNYSGTLAERLEACDTVIFLDLPRLTCLWRVIKRFAIHRGTIRSDMADGCPERFNLGFVSWIWNYRKRTRRKVVMLIEEYQGAKNVIWLRTRKEVERFVEHTRAA